MKPYNPRMSPFYKLGVKDIITHPFVIGAMLLIVGKVLIFGYGEDKK